MSNNSKAKFGGVHKLGGEQIQGLLGVMRCGRDE